MTTLRASEIPRMVDVDGHIDENLLRYGRGCYVRALAEVLEPRWEDEQEGDEWAYQRDAYDYWAADEWMPQPPSSLDLWELDLYEISAPAMRGLGGCGCFLCRTTGYTPALRSYRSGFEGFAATLAPIFDEASAWMTLASRAMDELNRSMSVRFDTAAFLGAWAEPEPPPKPVTCPDLVPSGADPATPVSEWALAPALPITPERFALVLPKVDATSRMTERRAFWDRPQPRRMR